MKSLFIIILLLPILLFADKQHQCLSLNIYFEARSSSFADQIAVADVTLNRVKSPRFPNTICTVVRQGQYYKGQPIKHRCQFSWYCDGESDKPLNKQAWYEAQSLALLMMYTQKYRGITEGALFYHADYVKPYWTSSMQYIGTIGRHKFYKEPK